MKINTSYTVVTGVTGFVGSAVVERLREDNVPVRACVRNLRALANAGAAVKGCAIVQIPDITADTDWQPALQNAGVVIHAAARVHVIAERAADSLAEFRAINVAGTLNLARQAAAAGTSRFIFISSIKVNGERTIQGRPFTAEDSPAPEDAYGISKLEAEQGLRELASETGMEVVIIRPPLVYGPGVKGNFASMIWLVEKGLPLPLGAIHNKRSLVALDNLVDLIITCLDHPAAANQVFLAGDGEDLSTTELLRAVAGAMGKPTRLVPVHAGLLMSGATVLGKKAVAQRLLGSLQVDISKARNLLGWTPPLSVAEGLKRCFPDH